MESFRINYRTIDITVSDDRIIGDGVSIGAENGHDDVRLMIRFSPMWNGTAKTVYWTDAQGVECEVTLLAEPNTNNAQNAVYQASVPVSVRRYSGTVGVTIFGAIIDPATDMETVVMSTEKAEFRVLPGIGSDVTSGAEIPATFAEQIQAQLNAAVAAVGDAVEGAEASATAAAGSATAAAGSATTANNAKEAAVTAKTDAQTASATATQKAAEAAQSATNAGLAKAAAQAAQTAAENAKSGAETARTGAETARTGAEAARTAAESARTGAATSASNANISARAAQDAANSMSFVSFDIDSDGDLYVNRSEHLGTTAFELNENGELEVSI